MDTQISKNKHVFSVPKIMRCYGAVIKARGIELKTYRDATTKEMFVELRMLKAQNGAIQ